MQFFLKCGVIFIFFLIFSLTGFALSVTDDCTGDSSLQLTLKNIQANTDIKNITQENIGASGYYTLERSKRYGEIVYQIENTESLTVKTYSPWASFFTVDSSGNLVRGFSSPLKEEIRGRLFTNPSVDVIIAPVNPLIPPNENVYYCTAGEFLYEFSRGRYNNPSHLRPYGLRIEASTDGVQYHTISDEFAAMQINGRGYLEEHQVKLSGEGPFIRLGLSCASTLIDESGIPKNNSVERPINIISVQFNIREKTPPEEIPSSSSSESEPPLPSSSETEPPSSSDSDFEDDSLPAVIHRSDSSSDSSSRRKGESYDSDDEPDIYEPNTVIQEPFSFTITHTHPSEEDTINSKDNFSDIHYIAKKETESSSSEEEAKTSKTEQGITSEEEIISSENPEISQISSNSADAEWETPFSMDAQEEEISENNTDKFDKIFLGIYSTAILLVVGELSLRAMKIYCQAKYQNPRDPKGKNDVNNSRSSKM